MSIVLVIIGLIVGGILTGQSLIRTAALRNQIKQIQDYQVAFATFQGKFDCIPGDCINATTFFGSTDAFGNAINNGNGNGQIDTNTLANYDYPTAASWSASTEMQGVFQQLVAAKLIDFYPSNPTSTTPNISYPTIRLNPTAGFFIGASYNFATAGHNPDVSGYQTGTNLMWFLACNSTSHNNMNSWDDGCGVFLANELLAIDQKIDDGKPLSGKLFGFGGAGGYGNNVCLSGSGTSATYDTSYTTRQCQAAYVIN